MKSPAFQFYPTDYLGSQRVQMMTLEEEGAYCRLLWSCWQHGSIPADPELAARLVGKGCSTTVARVVLPMFEVAAGEGRLTHDRLERERAKQAEWREKSSAGGKKSAEIRKGGSTVVPRVVQPPYQPKGNIPTPSPSSSPIPIPSLSPMKDVGPVSPQTEALNAVPAVETPSGHQKTNGDPAAQSGDGKQSPVARFTPPTLSECQLAGQKAGLPSIEVDRFWNFYESNGWKVGKNKMKSWPHALGGWKARREQERFSIRTNGHRTTQTGPGITLPPTDHLVADRDGQRARRDAIIAEEDARRDEEPPL